MKELACRDVSGMDCDFKAQGETAEEVKAKLMEHGNSAHAEAMASMTDEQKAGMAQKTEELLAAQM
jgi:predicted small metal-binding protein